MKYIRTKQGHIYKRLYKDGALNRGVGYIVQGVIMPFGEDVIEESDTIEELCDEFVYKYVNPYHQKTKPCYELVDMTLENMKGTMEMTSGATFYGAIWTDEGLIYVAKMNNKGEFELL